jgi:phytoene desaturase
MGHRTKKRIAVIGAGPGGLASAMLLARSGADVTIFERLDRLGGRSSSIEAPSPAGRFSFDMGPTFFLYPRVLADIFATCGRSLDKEVELLRVDPQYHLVFEGGGGIRASSDMTKLAEEVARICPADAAALPRFMTDNRAKLEAFRPVFEMPFNSAFDLLRPKMLRGLSLLRPFTSVDRDLSRYFSDERVRLAFSFQSKYLGMSPFRCPALFTILAFMEYEFGVWHPVGGCGAVMAAMGRVAQDLGARIKLDTPIRRILFEGKRACGVRTDAGDEMFDAVVINADFAQAMSTLVPDHLRRRWTDRKIAGKKFSCSTFMLYLGLEGKIPELDHHTIYLSKDYRQNVTQIEEATAPPTNPSFYVQNACVTDPSLAPPGHSTLYALVPVGRRVGQGIDWAREQAGFRETTLDRLQALGVPDIRARIRTEKMLTPTGWEQDLNVYHGATFNLAHNLGQMLHLRPRNRFEDLDNVYLVGGGTHPGSGLPVIFESARITTKLLAEDLDLSMADGDAATSLSTKPYAHALGEVT